MSRHSTETYSKVAFECHGAITILMRAPDLTGIAAGAEAADIRGYSGIAQRPRVYFP
jgi:hypothetical protein